MPYDPLLWQTARAAGAPFVLAAAPITLVNGANTHVAQQGTVMFITGPSGAFSITSVQSAETMDGPIRAGTVVTFYNTTAQNMTVVNEAGAGLAKYRIHTSTGGDLVTAGEGYVTLVYDSSISRWRDIGFSS